MDESIKPDKEYGIYEFLIRKGLNQLPIDNKEGLYLFLNRKNEIIYVGWASMMMFEIQKHLEKSSPETRHIKNFIKEINRIEIYYEETVRKICRQYSELNAIEAFLKIKHTYNQIKINAVLQS